MGRDFLSNVFQDFARYPVSLRENITIGRKGPVSEEELWQAVEAAGLAGTAKQLKDGLDTVLGKAEEGSLDLSGGQWQRIALARCILSPAAVRILDEPTSSLDPIRESEIYTGFRQMSRGKTVLLISHRLASVKLSDHIFVIAGGRVAEEGSHAQLMRKDGLYRKMYEEQAKWYEEGKNSAWKWKGGEEACERAISECLPEGVSAGISAGMEGKSAFVLCGYFSRAVLCRCGHPDAALF